VASIPANHDYPVMNLGQAATVALYELRELTMSETQLPDVERHRADEAEIERFYEHAEGFPAAIDYPEEKREKAMRMLRRMVGRAHPTDREVNTVLGLMRRAENRME